MTNNIEPSNDTSDLPDNKHDLERMKQERTVIDLADVTDIPGQEHIKPAPMGDLADVTASSADEEGEGLWPEESNTVDNGDQDKS